MTVLELVRSSSRRSRTATASRPPRPAAAAALRPPPARAPAEPAVEEQTEFSAVLTEIGPNKIPVIKVVRELTGLGLKEAKDLVDASRRPSRKASPREEADKIKAALEEQGAKVEIK